MTANAIELTFWGVRGSIPTPVSENLGFGGNTACIAIRVDGQPPLIFDAGSGICRLGNTLRKELALHIFLTHFHWDHIQGIPCFAPLFDANCSTTIHSSREPADLERILAAQMLPPYFPVVMPAYAAYRQIENDGTRIGPLLVRPFPLHHPNGATGYRIECADVSIVYACDHEHGNPATDAILRRYADHADFLIYDAQYTTEEYEQRRGWGHSTWGEAVKFAREARVKQLILFHHDPLRTDGQLDRIVRDAQSEFENTIAAKEGWCAKF
ncbi:MAG TPA: MBL fold metallo-hydrolase [Bryobacteraceae bacterium]|nr:MBL fold metallo-hydrolase [Bryobacteraceae bacterium]